MTKKCDLSGTTVMTGNNVSHSHKKTRRIWNANLQTVRVLLPSGEKKKMKVCTRCIRSNKIEKAV